MSRTTSIAELLCRHIRTLKAQHKAGITPHFGQLDDLFDLGEQLEESVLLLPVAACQPKATQPIPCSAPGCVTRLVNMRVNGRCYCRAHGIQMEAALNALGRLAPTLHAAVVAGETGGAA